MENVSSAELRYYILVGDKASWHVAFEKNQWGFSERNIGSWNTSNEGDFIAFYVTAPVKKIVGFGRIKRKFTSNDIFWPDENFFKRSIWKYRIQFEIIHRVKQWEDGIDVPINIVLNVGRKVIQKHVFESFIKTAESKWNKKIISKFNL